MKVSFEFEHPIFVSRVNLNNGITYPSRIGEWLFVGDATVEPDSIQYNITKMHFNKNEFEVLPITYDEFHIDQETAHEMIVQHLALEHSDEFLKPTPQEITEQSTFKENEMLNRISKENGGKSILEVVEDMRLNANNIWESLSA